MPIPQSLNAGDKLHSSFLEGQKRLLSFHRTESASRPTISNSPIYKPHWSPGVPSSSPRYPKPGLRKIEDSPLAHNSPSRPLADEVKNHVILVEPAGNVNEPSLSVEELSIEESPLTLLLRGGGKKDKINSTQIKGKGCLKNGKVTGLGESESIQQEDGIADDDLPSCLTLGEEAIHQKTLECEAETKSVFFGTKRQCMLNMENLLKKLKDLNQDVSDSLVDSGSLYIQSDRGYDYFCLSFAKEIAVLSLSR